MHGCHDWVEPVLDDLLTNLLALIVVDLAHRLAKHLLTFGLARSGIVVALGDVIVIEVNAIGSHRDQLFDAGLEEILVALRSEADVVAAVLLAGKYAILILHSPVGIGCVEAVVNRWQVVKDDVAASGVGCVDHPLCKVSAVGRVVAVFVFVAEIVLLPD